MTIYDCIVIGAGPGGLQAAIHLCRFRRRVLVVDGGGGRTRHARHIENFLGLELVTGGELIDTGLAQAARFGAEIVRAKVTAVEGGELFTVRTEHDRWQARFVIASSGGREILPPLANLGRHFARSVHTCVDCDGYRVVGRQTLMIGSSLNSVRLAFGIRKMFTERVGVLAVGFTVPEDYRQLLEEDGITLHYGEPKSLRGEGDLEGVELADGSFLPCEAIFLGFGMQLNDGYLAGLHPDRDAEGYKILTHGAGETSVPNLFAVGALRPGHAQAVIAAGQGCAAAIEINGRLLGL
ncbi:MAG: NAD(P)/FAD-dependent oxidoreductase [Thermodesulfobacteriota bacterium]